MLGVFLIKFVGGKKGSIGLSYDKIIKFIDKGLKNTYKVKKSTYTVPYQTSKL